MRRESAPTPALLAAIARGEEPARAELVRLWGPTVLRWCARLSGPGLDEEDLAHDVFERVIGKVHRLRAPEAFSSWLFQTTRRVVRDHRRAAWWRRWLPGVQPEAVDPRPGPHRIAETRDEALRVRASLGALPEPLGGAGPGGAGGARRHGSSGDPGDPAGDRQEPAEAGPRGLCA